MNIVDHRLEGVRYQNSPNQSGSLPASVSLLVMHDTAGRLNTEGTVNWLCNPRAKASAHLVIGVDGEIVQLVPFNKCAWHAGKSSWDGRPNVNAFSIGIELVNPGHLTGRRDATRARAWFKQEFMVDKDRLTYYNVDTHPAGWWMEYTEEQLRSAIEAGVAIANEYGVEEIVTHWMVSPSRKIDTGPQFPLEHYRGTVLGRNTEDRDDDVPDQANRAPRLKTITALNVREWPHTESKVKKVLDRGHIAPIIRSGYFMGAKWHLVRDQGTEGWVHGGYVNLL